MNTKEIIFDLCSVSGVSGREDPALDAAEKYVSYFSKKTIRKNGSLIAYLGQEDAEKTILLDAHIDRIGFMVTYIDEKGFAKVSPCGGIDVRTAADSRLFAQNSPETVGTVCCLPPHLSDGGDDKAFSADKLWVDFGLPRSELQKLISIGDMLTFQSSPVELTNGRIAAPCLDNRCGVASLIKCAELLADCELSCRVAVLFSSQEETFGAGAKTAAYLIDPDEALVVDVSFASQPDVTGFYSSVELDKGPMICRSSVLDREMSDVLTAVAESAGIPFQIEPIAGATGTNADRISAVRGGVKTAVVSIPQRYMHTQNEVVSVSDVDNTARLAAEYIKKGGVVND